MEPTGAGDRRKRAAATLLGGCGVLLWATETGLITLAGRLPPLETVALAFAAAALPTPLVWRLCGTGPRAALRQPLRVWLVTVAMLLAYHGCLYAAVRGVPAAPAALLQGCTPLVIVVGSALLPGERVRWWHLAGTAAGLAGVVTLVAGRDGGPLAGDQAGAGLLVVAAAAALWGGYSLLARTLPEVPSAAMGGFYAATALAAGLGHLLLERWVTPGPAKAAAVLGLGLLPMGGALYLWDHGVKRGDLQALGAFSYAEPFLGAAFVALLGEGRLSWSLLWAGVLVVGGAALAARGLWDPGAGTEARRAARPAFRPRPGPPGGRGDAATLAVLGRFERTLASNSGDLEAAILEALGPTGPGAARLARLIAARWTASLRPDASRSPTAAPARADVPSEAALRLMRAYVAAFDHTTGLALRHYRRAPAKAAAVIALANDAMLADVYRLFAGIERRPSGATVRSSRAPKRCRRSAASGPDTGLTSYRPL